MPTKSMSTKLVELCAGFSWNCASYRVPLSLSVRPTARPPAKNDRPPDDVPLSQQQQPED
eukprot:gene3553-5988_t